MPGVPIDNAQFVIDMFDELNANAQEVQNNVLKRILEENSNTEYLRRHGLSAGMSDPESFKAAIPLIRHADIEDDLKRIAEGDKSAILMEKPIDTLFLSSGTSNGRSKMIPMQKDFFLNTIRMFQISGVFRSRAYPTSSDGKVMDIVYCGKQFLTKGGLRVGTGTTNYFLSEAFRLKQKTTKTFNSSPNEVIFSPHLHQAMFSHLLFGLLNAADVQFISSTFVYTVVEAFRFMEEHWRSLCQCIEDGSLPAWITDTGIRRVCCEQLRPDPSLANLVRSECLKGFKGILPRLWRKAKYVYAIMTGTMESYGPKMKYYAGNLPLVSGDYGASEGWVGVNVNPRASPEETTFTVVPDLAYFEFIPLVRCSMNDKNKATSLFAEFPPVSLTQVKVGEEYEIVMTTFGGLYRYRLGDIVRVTGFYKSAPQFKYICRRDVLLSIHIDKIGERDLEVVFAKASYLLRKVGVEVVEYTTQADRSTDPGRYVVFVELDQMSGGGRDEIDDELQEYCNCLDKSFVEPGYVLSRAANRIGSLKLCVVETGTFHKLVEAAVDGGGAFNQYKTPRCVAAPTMLKLLRAGIVKVYHSE